MNEIEKRIEWSKELINDVTTDVNEKRWFTALSKSITLTMYVNWITEQIFNVIDKEREEELIKKLEGD